MYNGVYTIEAYAYIHDTLMKWLKDKIAGDGLGQKLMKQGIFCVAVYGANELGQMVCCDIERDMPVYAYIDKNMGMPGKMIGKQAVWGLEDLEKLPDECYILVTPEIYFREILEDLTDRGIPLQRIISLSMVVNL